MLAFCPKNVDKEPATDWCACLSCEFLYTLLKVLSKVLAGRINNVRVTSLMTGPLFWRDTNFAREETISNLFTGRHHDRERERHRAPGPACDI